MSNKSYEQLSLFTPSELKEMTPKKKLFALVVAKEGHSWWQELPRVKGKTSWQTCIDYRKKVLGPGYWIEKYELR